VRTVQEYRVEWNQARFTLWLPDATEILHVALDGGHLNLWALVDTEAEPVPRRFLLVTTREEIAADLRLRRHVATCGLADGRRAIHLFEVQGPRAAAGAIWAEALAASPWP
jgi:hypothetical protein